jgi:2-polyprenyl-3-methyl-5-hydroxy-6-metoxy-1,4-benzoquinol methylase
MTERRTLIYEQEREAARRYAPDYDAAYDTPFFRTERQAFAADVAARARRAGLSLATARVLDIGTGTGLTLLELRRLGAVDVVAIDISLEMLALAQEKLPEADLRLGTIEDVVEEEASFDIVTGFSVLHHLPHLASFFCHVARVLRPGGIFAFSDPHSASLLIGRYSKWIFWGLVYPLQKPLRYVNRHELARRPSMTDVELYSEAHRRLSIQEVARALPPSLEAKFSSHGILAPPFNNAVIDAPFDLAVLRVARTLDRALPLPGDVLVVNGRRLPDSHIARRR